MIEVLTDNKNRTIANVRNILARAGGQLVITGSVSRLFRRQGIIALDGNKYTEDQVIEAAIEGGAQDINRFNNIIEVSAKPEDFEMVVDVLAAKKFETITAEMNMVPDTEIFLDNEGITRVFNLIEKLEENEDI